MSFPQMVDMVPEGVSGDVRIEHFEIDQHAATMANLGNFTRPLFHLRPGRYARLTKNHAVLMTDTAHERRSNNEFDWKAHGRVLIAGLGLGMIIHPLLSTEREPSRRVSRVVVVEKSEDVIALVGPTIRDPRVEIIHADIFEWRPPKGETFNTIYFDIWGNVSEDDLDSMVKLHRGFSSRLARNEPRPWMNSWMCEHLRLERRRNKEMFRSR